MVLPEKKTDVLYVRITPTNYKYITNASEKSDVSKSSFVDHLINVFRRNDRTNKPNAKNIRKIK